MTEERSNSIFKNWLILGLIVVIALLVWRGKKTENTNFTLNDKVERLTGDIAIIEHERNKDKALIAHLTVQKDVEEHAKQKKLTEYKGLPIKSKVQKAKVFQPSAVTTDSTICFTEEGIDSINKLSIHHKSAVQQLNLSDSVISVQQKIIASDSLQIGKEREVAKEYKAESVKQTGKVKFWKGVTIGVSALSAGIIASLLLR